MPLRGWFVRNRIRFLVAGLLAGVLATTGLLWADYACKRAAHGRIFRSLDAVPSNAVALVLGTSRLTPRGSPNLHFNQRIDAAVALYRAAKVKHLLVRNQSSSPRLPVKP